MSPFAYALEIRWDLPLACEYELASTIKVTNHFLAPNEGICSKKKNHNSTPWCQILYIKLLVYVYNWDLQQVPPWKRWFEAL